ADLVHGPQADWGQLSCGCHPDCGMGMAPMIDKETKEAVPVTAFLNADQLAKFDKCFGATGRKYGKVTADRTMADIEQRRADRWNFLFIASMWFQDLFNYDFRRTEQCIIP